MTTTALPRSDASDSSPSPSSRGEREAGATTRLAVASAPVTALSLALRDLPDQQAEQRRRRRPTAQRPGAPRRRRRGHHRDDEDGRADRDLLEQPLRLGDLHPDAAVRGGVADRGGVGRAVDADARATRSPSSACRAGCRARAGSASRPSPSPTSGGYHHGLRHLTTISKLPSGRRVARLRRWRRRTCAAAASRRRGRACSSRGGSRSRRRTTSRVDAGCDLRAAADGARRASQAAEERRDERLLPQHAAGPAGRPSSRTAEPRSRRRESTALAVEPARELRHVALDRGRGGARPGAAPSPRAARPRRA